MIILGNILLLGDIIISPVEIIKTNMKEIKYKFREDEFLQDIKQYVDSTYFQHYAGSAGNNVQVMDLLFANEPTAVEFARGAVIKYAMRYGKKDGYNKKDLLKAIHYLLFMLYSDYVSTHNAILEKNEK